MGETLDYLRLESRFLAWARSRPDVRAAVVVGSRARPEQGADEWSDLDYILYVDDPAPYAGDAGWLTGLAETWLCARDETGAGETEWFVMYAGGLKLDVVLSAAAPGQSLAEVLAASPHRMVFRRGLRVAYDRLAGQAGLAAWDPGAGETIWPSPEQFAAAVQLALFDALRMAKLIRRGDLWRAWQTGEVAFRRRLLEMIVWHTCACHGDGRDTWYDGRDLAQWADPEVVAALPDTFGTFSAPGLWQGLMAGLRLYRRLGEQAAPHLGAVYPGAAHEQVVGWMQANLRPEAA